MAVPENAAVTVISSASLCQTFSQAVNVVHPAGSEISLSAGSDVKLKTTLTQPRLIQAVPVGPGRSSASPQVFRIVKPSEIPNVAVPNHLKGTLASPIKGTIINLPSGSKVLARPGTKLKVGDTITLQKPCTASENASVQPMVPPTAAKFVTVGSSHQTHSMLGSVAPASLSHASAIVTSNTPRAGQASPSRLGNIPQVWTQSPQYKRSALYDSLPASESKRRRTPTSSEKGSKGLRHFAMLVCEKVKQKVTTTYNEVADELVAEYTDAQKQNDQAYDQKNIRRRVYDALNVLMAMEIIYKDKKDIHWVGLPTNSVQEVQALQIEKKKREQRIQQKTLQLQELILQQIAFKNLVQRNKRIQQAQGPPPENSSIQLPFIIVNTSKKTVIDCSISNDKYEYMFNFDNTFEIHDDIEVLKRMGMAYGLEAGTCTPENLKTAQTLVPPVLKPYLQEMAGQARVSGGNTSTVAQSYQSTRAELAGIETPDLPQVIKVEKVKSASLMFPALDSDDQEVAMVTDESQRSGSSNGIIASMTSSSASSSTLCSGMLSLTPASSCADFDSGGSRGSTPVGATYDA